MVENEIRFLKENDIVRGEYFNEELIGLTLPPKVTLLVKTSPDAVAGNTSSGATKRVILETGLELFTPLFIKEGDSIIVSTEDATYSERAKALS
jgi:elongation factor P